MFLTRLDLTPLLLLRLSGLPRSPSFRRPATSLNPSRLLPRPQSRPQVSRRWVAPPYAASLKWKR